MQVVTSRLYAATITDLGKSCLNSYLDKRLRSLFYAGLLSFSILSSHVAVYSAPSVWRDDIDLGSRPFWMNVIYFQDSETEATLTEVIIEVPYQSLIFRKIGETYETNVDAGVALEDANGFQVDNKFMAEKIRTKNFITTLADFSTQLFYFTFRLEPGSYTLHVIVGDDQARERYSAVCQIKTPSFHQAQPQISSLLLARQIERTGKTAIVQKNGRSIVPNVAHVFSAEQPNGFVYFETYNLSPTSAVGDSFQVYCFISQAGREVSALSWKSLKPGAKAAIHVPLNFRDVGAGEYLLTVKVVDLNSRREARAVAIFYLSRPLPPSLGLL